MREVPEALICTRRPGASDTACRCSPECRALAAKASKIRHVRNGRGIPGRVPASVCLRHLKAVLAARPGSTVNDFSRASGVSEKTLRNLTSGRSGESLYRATAHRILSTRPEALEVVDRRLVSGERCQRWMGELQGAGFSIAAIATEADLSTSTLMPGNLHQVHADTQRRLGSAYSRLMSAPSTSAYVPGFRVRRRVEALMVLGWTSTAIAREAGVSRATITRSSQRVPAATYAGVERAFLRLRYRIGPSRVTERRAKEMGYAGWASWPQGSMDREDGKPDLTMVDDPTWREAIRSRRA